MSEKLLPCPFCGAQPMIEDMHEGDCGAEITCANSECRAIISVYEDTEEKSIAAWNTRVDHSRQRLVSALNAIAAWNDVQGNSRLQVTGSYSAFDEPASVEVARTALADIGGEK